MKWDIFGKKKLNKNIDRLEGAILELTGDIRELKDKVNHIEKSMSENMVEIPELKARIRNVEDVYNEEQKEEREKYSLNMYKN